MKYACLIVLILMLFLCGCSARHEETAPNGWIDSSSEQATSIPTVTSTVETASPAPTDAPNYSKYYPHEIAPTQNPSPTTEPTPDPEFPNTREVELLPWDYSIMQGVEPGTDSFKCTIEGTTYTLTMGENEMELYSQPEQGNRELLLTGMAYENYEGILEDGFFLSSVDFGSDTEYSLPKNRLMFYRVSDGKLDDFGEALYHCIMTEDALIGACYERNDPTDNTDWSGIVKLIKMKLSDKSRTVLQTYEVGSADPHLYCFYPVLLEDGEIYFTFVKAASETTDFGIFKLDPNTGECVKAASHGVPISIDENGNLLYGDYAWKNPEEWFR